MKPFPAYCMLALLLCSVVCAETAPVDASRWVPLFNGRNLGGWTVKIAGHAVGDNYADTYRVEDGVIKAYYDKYPRFDLQFGHLYTNVAYSHYILRLEYRFAGEMMSDAPEGCNTNSGVMIHAQSPLSMTREQLFPVSLECQFLANVGSGPRQTANLCTPGTNVMIDGKLVTQHIVRSTAPVFPLEEWVGIEVEVHGSESVVYRVNGTEVLRYHNPQLDMNESNAHRREDVRRLVAVGAPSDLSFGHIALQAEGHPVWFRRIELLSLPGTTDRPSR